MKISKQKELAIEAVNLVKEFKKHTSHVIENIIKDVRLSSNSDTVIVETVDGEKLEYILSKVTCILNKQFSGFSESTWLFYSEIEIAKLQIESLINKISKEEFVQAIGNVCYAECVGEKVYSRLREIEKEAKELIK